MHTIRLKVNDAIYEKLLWLLSRFSENEIENVVENSTFINDQNYVEKELKKFLTGEARFIGAEAAKEQLTLVSNAI